MTSQRIVFVLASTVLFSSVLEGSEKVVYAARITDLKGEEFLVTEFYRQEARQPLPFSPGDRCFRFDCKRGESEIEIPFEKLSSVSFFGEPNNPIRNHRAANVTMVGGNKTTMYVQLASRVGESEHEWCACGRDVDLGSWMRIRLGDVKTIHFLHDGSYKKCPVCSTRFYDDRLTHCPFDKARLEPQSE